MKALGSSKIWILVPDWSRLKSSEPKAGDVTRKISHLYLTCWHDWQVFLMAINLYTYLDKRLTMFDRGNKSANLFYGPIFCLLSFMRAWRNQIAHRYSWSLISSTARIITWFSSTPLWRWWTRAQIWKFENLKTILILQGFFLPHFVC